MKWEYKVVNNCDEDHLKKLGNEGWELVQIRPSNDFYFKRPITEGVFSKLSFNKK